MRQIPLVPRVDATEALVSRLVTRLRQVAAFPLLIGVVGLALSLAVAATVSEKLAQHSRAQFLHSAEEARRQVEQAFELPLFGVRAAAGLVQVLDAPDAAAFRRFVEQQDMAASVGGVRGLGVIERVPRSELPAFVKRQQSNDRPDFGVHQLTASEAADLYIITRVEPLHRNRRALGLDMGSEARRRATVEQAALSGQATLSPPITLVQDGGHKPGFLAVQPVYRPGLPLNTPAQREAALARWVYAPIVVDELLQRAPVLADPRIGVELFYGGPAGERVFAHTRYPSAASIAGVDEAGTAPQRADYPIRLVGSNFTLRVTGTEAFASMADRWLVAAVSLAGLMLTALLASLAHSYATARRRAEARAGDLSVELSRLDMVARLTSNGVVMLDAGGRVTWANDTFERISGLQAAAVMGQDFHGLRAAQAGTPPARPVSDAAPEPQHGEVCYLRPDGAQCWVSYDIQPLMVGSIDRYSTARRNSPSCKGGTSTSSEPKSVVCT